MAESGPSGGAECAATPPIYAEGMMALDPAGRPVLIGGRRRADGALVYPIPGGGDALDHAPVVLPREGRLWSFTVQRFRPKPPFAQDQTLPFTPYVVGYVDLGGALIVEARIAADPEALKLGMALRLDAEPFRGSDGRAGLIPVFRADPAE